jgi:mercuric ion binding protein
MRLHAPAFALIGLLVAAPLFAAEQTVKFAVPDMYCASCPFIVESAMGGVDGVISVTADSDTRTALVVFDDEIATVADIAAASASAGYEATVTEGET